MDDVDLVRDWVRKQLPSLPDRVTRPTVYLDVPREPARAARCAEAGRRVLGEGTGKVAVLMLAGGLSTRWGRAGLRGNLPVCPLSNDSIFRLHGARIAALSRRYGPIPWLIMTSDEVQRETEDSFRKEAYFDVDPTQVDFVQQPSLPVLDAALNPVTNPDGSLRRYPTGHGGMIEALHRRQDILSKLDDQNIENIYCFIYPNVLESICDPVMLGYHVQGRFEFTTKGIPYHEYTPQEKLGRIVLADGTLRIVEYHEIQGMSGDDSYFWNTVPASMATHVWSVPFLKRCCGEVTLPFHPIQRDGLWRVEQYAFDLLPHARSNGLVLVSRTDQYCPIKEPDDLPRARHALARLYRNRVKHYFDTWGDFLISDP